MNVRTIRARRCGGLSLVAVLGCAALSLPSACKNPPDPSSEDGGAKAGEGGSPTSTGEASTDAAQGDSGSGDGAEDAGASDAAVGAPDAGTFPLPQGAPATVLLDGAQLAAVQGELVTPSPAQKAALQNLIAAANEALGAGTWTVMSKAAAYVANSDPHEYASWGPYWWPPDAVPPGTPGTISTCPYKQFDGIQNPNVALISDRHGLHASSEAIFELALAWYFTGNPAYADQAELVARTWYLDTATAMNPDMAYAQQHGPCGAGNAAGLIEASGGYMTDALDGLAILALDARPSGWTAADQAGIKAWMTKFLAWIVASPIGIGEQAALNNHGTWYDALVSSIDLFLGDTAGATSLVNASKTKRIAAQITGSGSMPQELARTTSWHYSNFNAAGLCRLAAVAKHVGVDLWSYEAPDGGSLVRAVDFLIPTATTAQPPGPWAQYNDITVPFDAVYQAESYYSIRAAGEYASDPLAQAVFTQSPVAVQVPGHGCAGDRFPTGSDFCAITPGTAPFADLQDAGTAATDMWPLIPTCRVPID